MSVTEPQPDSESAHVRGARTSLELFATATVTRRLSALVEHQHVGVLEPGPQLVQLDALLGTAERPGQLPAARDEHAELHINAHIIFGKYFLPMMGRLSSQRDCAPYRSSGS